MSDTNIPGESAHDKLREVVSQTGAHRSGPNPNQYAGRCPAHDDGTDSFSVSIGDDEDKIVVKCFTGCTEKQIAEALGKTVQWFFCEKPRGASAGDKPKPKPDYHVPPEEWEKRFAGWAQNFGEHARAKLADILDVPERSFVHFPLLDAHNEHRLGPCFVHPEVDADLRITGASLRIPGAPNGQDKPSAAGSKRGLTVPLGWKERPGALYVVEGLSDTIAGTAGGLAVSGRPGVAAGLRLVADVVEKRVEPDRMVVIVGENDLRCNNKNEWEWPGRDKALKFAQDLSAEIGRPVHICFPPNSAKDLRDWATRLVADGAFWSEIADRWTKFTKPEPVAPATAPRADGTFAAAGPEGKSVKADGRGRKVASGAVDPSGVIAREGLDKKGDSDSAGETPIAPARWEAALDRLQELACPLYCTSGPRVPLFGIAEKTLGHRCVGQPKCRLYACPGCHVFRRRDAVQRICPPLAEGKFKDDAAAAGCGCGAARARSTCG